MIPETNLGGFSGRQAEAMGLIAAEDVAALDPLLSHCRRIAVEPGAVILKNDSANAVAYILLSGRLEVTLDPGQTAAIAEIKPGELVGEVSALVGKTTSAWVEAAEASELVELERETLLAMARTSHHFSYALLHSVCNRLYSSNRAAHRSEQESQQNLRRSMTDPLTGLKNRAWLENALPALLQALQSDDSGLHLFMIDLDHFKVINDTWGHIAGDQVLREVAKALVRTLRPADHVVRMGGEEMIALTNNVTTAAAAMAVAERLRQAIERLRIQRDDSEVAIQLTTSIGWSRFHPGESLETVLERADQAVYRAKTGGRNRVEAG